MKSVEDLQNGLALLPGASAEKVVELYEQCFGKTRPQAIPCDSNIQVEDKSEELPPKEAFCLPFHCRDVPLPSQRSTRSALHGEGGQWGHVEAYLQCNDCISHWMSLEKSSTTCPKNTLSSWLEKTSCFSRPWRLPPIPVCSTAAWNLLQGSRCGADPWSLGLMANWGSLEKVIVHTRLLRAS